MKKLMIIASLVLASGMILTPGFARGGGVKIAGSTTVLPLAQVWAEKYSGEHRGLDISVSGGGTGTGISMLINGTCDIADASREAQTKEISAAKLRNTQLVATKLAKDGLAIIVHPDNHIKSLTMAQLAKIYKGQITNWKEVGGPNRNIVAIGRDTSSGTYGFFQEAVLDGDRYARNMLSLASNAAVEQATAQSEGGIGYVGLAFAKEGEHARKVKIIGIAAGGKAPMEPTDETVMSGKYPLFRYLYAYTLGKPRGEAAAFLKFATSSEGQSMVHGAGYLPLK